MELFSKHPLLTPDERKKIADTIAQVERKTNGEIRVSIRKRRAWSERKLTLHRYALKNFFELGMEKTRHKTGVLLFISMSERAFQIIADEGIHNKVSDRYWDDLAAAMSAHFKEKRFCEGICELVNEIGKKLEEEFPRSANDPHELSNDVSIK